MRQYSSFDEESGGGVGRKGIISSVFHKLRPLVLPVGSMRGRT
jgi:hypothetical protein